MRRRLGFRGGRGFGFSKFSKMGGFNGRSDTNDKKFISDDKIIIPNSKIPLQVGGLESFPMELSEFNDRMYGKLNEMDGIYFNNSMVQASNHTNFLVKKVRLDNGFCYAEMLCTNYNLNIKYITILYIDKKQNLMHYLPIAGNNVNRITEGVPQGNDDDMFWLWENLNWGKPRPREPIKYELSEFQRLMLSYELIEAEVASKATIVPKEKKDESQQMF